MKRIIWFTSAAALIAIGGVVLQTAQADDVPYSDEIEGEITGPQANTFFGSYADDKCTLGKSKLKRIVFEARTVDEVLSYWHTCVGESVTDPDTLVAYMASAALSGGAIKVVNTGIAGVNEKFDLFNFGTLSAAEFSSYQSAFVTAACTLPIANTAKITLTKQPSDMFAWKCISVDANTPEAIHALRATAASDDNRQVDYIGQVVEQE